MQKKVKRLGAGADGATQVWVTTKYSPARLTDALRQLNVQHSVEVTRTGPRRRASGCVKEGGQDKVHITRRLDDVRPGICNFIVCCHAEAVRIRAPKLPEKCSLLDAVRYALECEVEGGYQVDPETTPLQYVAAVSAPSLISEIQTHLLRVNPYALRKSAEALVIATLSGGVSTVEAKRRFRNNLRTASIADLLDKAAPLRKAVISSRSMGVEAAAELHQVPTFEINYVRKKCDSATDKGGTTS